jgi:translocation and assembly module TamA
MMLSRSRVRAFMRRRCDAAMLLFCCACCASVCAQESVRFRLVVDAPSQLRDMLRNGLDLARWQGYQDMSPALLETLVRDAREQAREAAATAGYYDAQVSATIEREGDARVVHLKVDPGTPTRVERVSITFAGNADAEAQARVRREWALPPGEIFRQDEWETAKKRAVIELAAAKYASARVLSSQATVNPDLKTAALEIELDSGPVFFFGPLSVTGLSKYQRAAVTNLAPFRTGDVYSREKIELFLRRLTATNYFASAQISVDDNREAASAAPVTVAVIEAPTKRLDAGIGYSTDTLYRATINWRDVNIFDSGWRLRGELRLESKLQTLGGALDLPARDDGWADSLDAAATRTDIQNLVTRGFVLGATRRRVDERRQPAFGASYYYEQQDPEGAPRDVARALFARYEYTRRTTDDIVFPRAGYVAALRLGASAPGLSTRTFGRTVGQLAWYRPLARHDDLVLRAEAGAVLAHSSDGIPQALLFRTGGDTTVRGYSFGSLGVNKGSAIVGGRYYALASTEYIHWFADLWGLAAFVDAGNAADSVGSLHPRVGYGAGLRVRSPIGPFRLDVARGHETREFRLHFSAGLAF